jgi:hypothetical protein
VYGTFGAVMAALGAILAYRNARVSTTSFYANQVYNITANGHLRFAIASAIIAFVFVLGRLFFDVISVPLLALYAVLAILYGASFVRGATGEDE